MYIDAGENGLSIYVTNNLGTTNLGHIDLFGGTEDPNLSNYFTTTYCIHVDYWDTTNSDKTKMTGWKIYNILHRAARLKHQSRPFLCVSTTD